MALKLQVDRKLTENPGSVDIAFGFESIDKRKNFLHGGISLVTLTRDENHFLTAAGRPAEGFSLSYRDGDPLCDYFSNQTLPMDQVIQILQNYAADKDWGQANFTWDTMRSLDNKTALKRLAWLVAAGILVYSVFTFVVSKLR